jgi:hypothetical protein
VYTSVEEQKSRAVLRRTSPSLGCSSLTCLKVKGAPLDSKTAALYSVGSSGIAEFVVISGDFEWQSFGGRGTCDDEYLG